MPEYSDFLHDVYRVRLDIQSYMFVDVDKVGGLDHPLKAADIDDDLIVYAEEGDRGHDAAQHALFLGNDVHVLRTDDDVDRLRFCRSPRPRS